MNKLIISFLVLLMISNWTKAQSGAEQLADKIAQKMKDSLSLSAEQKAQLYTIKYTIE